MSLRRLVRLLKEEVESKRTFTPEMAKRIGDQIGVDWSAVDPEEFRMGLGVETEHDIDPQTDVVGDLVDVGKIALAHLKELPDYYTRLARMERGEGMGRSVFNADQPKSQ